MRDFGVHDHLEMLVDIPFLDAAILEVHDYFLAFLVSPLYLFFLSSSDSQLQRRQSYFFIFFFYFFLF